MDRYQLVLRLFLQTFCDAKAQLRNNFSDIEFFQSFGAILQNVAGCSVDCLYLTCHICYDDSYLKRVDHGADLREQTLSLI